LHSPAALHRRLVGLGLLQQRGVRARIDLREEIAFANVLALAEGYLLHLAVDSHLDGDGVVSLHGAEADAVDGEVSLFNGTRRHRDRA